VIHRLPVVYKEGKEIRICVDARNVNQYTVADRECTPPLQELLQKFEGAQFMTTFCIIANSIIPRLPEVYHVLVRFYSVSVQEHAVRVPEPSIRFRESPEVSLGRRD
jgi:hypothetical protein